MCRTGDEVVHLFVLVLTRIETEGSTNGDHLKLIGELLRFITEKYLNGRTKGKG